MLVVKDPIEKDAGNTFAVPKNADHLCGFVQTP